tara:strand:- start:53 stop:277 length:225 start_codon:yes stop_codon:yes gene_type:complete
MKPLLSVLLVLSSAISLNAEGEDIDGAKTIWKPVVGDTWTYKVVVEVLEGTGLPEGVEGQKVEKIDGKIRATYT